MGNILVDLIIPHPNYFFFNSTVLPQGFLF